MTELTTRINANQIIKIGNIILGKLLDAMSMNVGWYIIVLIISNKNMLQISSKLFNVIVYYFIIYLLCHIKTYIPAYVRKSDD